MILTLGEPGRTEPLVVGYRAAGTTGEPLRLVAAAGALTKEQAQWLKQSLLNMKATAKADEVHLLTDFAGRLIVAAALPDTHQVIGVLSNLARPYV